MEAIMPVVRSRRNTRCVPESETNNVSFHAARPSGDTSAETAGTPSPKTLLLPDPGCGHDSRNKINSPKAVVHVIRNPHRAVRHGHAGWITEFGIPGES